MTDEELETDHRFACNICFEQVSSEPVVTRCGHLYCWSCLFRWLEPGMTLEDRNYLSNTHNWRGQAVDRSRRMCPVCKSDCAVPTVIPIYVREEVPSKTGVEDTGKEERIDDVDDVDEMECIDETQEFIPVDDPVSLPPTERYELNEATGLRQRRNVRVNSTSRNETESSHAGNSNPTTSARSFSFNEIPARPQPPPAPRSTVTDTMANREVRHINVNRGSANFILLQNAIMSALQSGNQGSHHNIGGGDFSSSVPPLHNRRHSENGISDRNSHREAPIESATTELLSRILLVMGSFVILCLLLFS